MRINFRPTARLAIKVAFLISLLSIITACGGGGGSSGGGSPGGGGGPVVVAPSVTTQPVAATVIDGATANFSVTATGDAPLAYQWRRSGVDLVDSAGVVGATTATLALTSPYSFNASQMSVRITNAGGSITSNSALLTVTAIAPTITTQPANVSAIVGAAATFSVVTSGGTAPVTYQWKRSGTAIAGATTTTYTVATTVIGDNGAAFTLDITSPSGTLTSTAATLSVTAAGKSWGAATQINSGDANSDTNESRVVIDPAGNAIAVWQEIAPARTRNAVYANRYIAGGAWGTAETIDFGIGNGIAPEIAMNASGVAVAAFAQTTNNNGGTLDLVTNRFDSTWSSPITIESITITNAQFPDVSLANDGKATVVYSQSDGTVARIWVNSTSSPRMWGTPLIRDNSGGFFPQVATAANGHSVMTWSEQGDGANGRTIWASRNVGAGWLTPVLLTAERGSLESPMRIAMDANGNALVVWSQEFGNARNYVHAARLTASTGVWTESTINDSSHDSFSPQVVINANGDAVAVWYESDRHGGPQIDYGIRSNRYNAATKTWRGPIAVQPTSTGAVDPSVGIDKDGNAIAVWVQPIAARPTRAEVWTASLVNTAGASWTAATKLMTDPDAYTLKGYEPKIAMNANGEAVVVWYQRSDAPSAGIWSRVYR